MTDKPTYIDNVLIRLRRKYAKDEAFAGMVKSLAEKDVEIGGLKAEIDHLRYENKKQNAEITKLQQKDLVNQESKKENNKENKQVRLEAKKDKLFHQKEEKIKHLEQRLKEMKNNRDSLIATVVKLEKQTNK